jgi:hypothetical protein
MASSAIRVTTATTKLTVIGVGCVDRTATGMHHLRSVSAPQGDKGRVELGSSDSTHASVGLCSLYSVTDGLNSIYGKQAKVRVSHWYSGEAHVRDGILELVHDGAITKTNTSFCSSISHLSSREREKEVPFFLFTATLPFANFLSI